MQDFAGLMGAWILDCCVKCLAEFSGLVCFRDNILSDGVLFYFSMDTSVVRINNELAVQEEVQFWALGVGELEQ